MDGSGAVFELEEINGFVTDVTLLTCITGKIQLPQHRRKVGLRDEEFSRHRVKMPISSRAA